MKYRKEEILEAKDFKPYADILGVLLSDDAEYATAEVDKILKAYMKAEVKQC